MNVPECLATGARRLSGVLNLKLKDVPARPAREGINPFTKEPCTFKAKPASKTVKAFALKKLKDWDWESALSAWERVKK